jgi:hypothetical protein
MGTRSLTIVQDGHWRTVDGKKIPPEEVMVMYRQMDGYPEGHGADLVRAFGTTRLCNGYGARQSSGEWANGMGCLAAQVVAHFKQGIGGIYLHSSGTRDCGEEYIYYLYAKNLTRDEDGEETLCLKVVSVGWGETPSEVLYDGTMINALNEPIFGIRKVE